MKGTTKNGVYILNDEVVIGESNISIRLIQIVQDYGIYDQDT